MARGFIFYQQAKHADAIADFSRVIELNPEAAGALNNRGDNRFMVGEFKGAIEDYDAAIKLVPTYGFAHQNRAWLLSTVKDESLCNSAEAVKSGEVACKFSNFQSLGDLSAFAAALAANGDFEVAIGWQEKAVELAPENMKAFSKTILERYRSKLPHASPEEVGSSQEKETAAAPTKQVVFGHQIKCPVPFVLSMLSDGINQAKAMFGFAKQDNSSIGNVSLIVGRNFDAGVDVVSKGLTVRAADEKTPADVSELIKLLDAEETERTLKVSDSLESQLDLGERSKLSKFLVKEHKMGAFKFPLVSHDFVLSNSQVDVILEGIRKSRLEIAVALKNGTYSPELSPASRGFAENLNRLSRAQITKYFIYNELIAEGDSLTEAIQHFPLKGRNLLADVLEAKELD